MRYFLIDKVTELVVGQRARGIKNVTLSDEILHDHFPDHPILPGALIVEACAQLAGYLLEAGDASPGPKPRRALLVQIDKAKFHDTTGPGDRLDIEVNVESILDAAARVRAVVQVGDRRILRTELTFVMKDIDSDRVHEQRRYIYGLWTKDLEPKPPIP